MALVLATDDSPASLVGVFPGFVAMWNDLQAGGKVADIGCGQGTSTIMMAERFPASSFTGFDHSDAVIALEARP